MSGFTPKEETSFDMFWVITFSLFCGMTLLGIFSIGKKKYLEKLKEMKVLSTIKVSTKANISTISNQGMKFQSQATIVYKQRRLLTMVPRSFSKEVL